MTRHEMNTIAKVTIPMFMIMDVVLIVFPDLATWLPESIRQRPTP